MIRYNGRLRMTLGDYGVPLLLRFHECPRENGEGPKGEDTVRAELLRSGQRVFARETTYGELKAGQGIMELYLTPEEAGELELGLYTLRVLLLREGVACNTLLSTVLEVLP